MRLLLSCGLWWQKEGHDTESHTGDSGDSGCKNNAYGVLRKQGGKVWLRLKRRVGELRP